MKTYAGNKKVLFVVPYPLHCAPSQRFRVETFLTHLSSNGVDYKLEPFLDEDSFSIFYKKGLLARKAFGVLKGFLRRFRLLLSDVPKYEFIFIHREASPVGPPFFEFIASKVFRKKIIYDFDDAIWIPDSGNRILNWFKAFWKTRWICRWAHKVVGGNEYLCSYACKYNKNVVLIPTCVDTELQHNLLKDQEEQPVIIGWTGSHSTLKYLDPLVPLLSSLTEEFSIRILVICNQPPSFSFNGLDYIKWSKKTEVDDLLRMNVGIMPLSQDEWSEGKCGFKLIQYLSLGIPAVASPVGVNTKIIGENEISLLCNTQNEWREALICLINDKDLRTRIGEAGRERIIESYSVQAYVGRFLELFG